MFEKRRAVMCQEQSHAEQMAIYNSCDAVDKFFYAWGFVTRS